MNPKEKPIILASGEIDRLPDAMLDIMLVLWAEGRPMKATEILTALGLKHTWKRATLHVLLGRLEERGFLSTKEVSNYKLYTPLISEDDYIALESKTILQKLCRGSFSTLASSLIRSRSLTENDLSELSALIEENKKTV